MSTVRFASSAEGKRVVDVDGEVIGVVSGVRNGTASVDPDPDISDEAMAKLGWDELEEGDYPLDRSNVDGGIDDDIHLKRAL